MGELDRAQPYCDALLREFPKSAAAHMVVQRRSRLEKAVPTRRQVERGDSLEDAAKPQPEQAKPTQAQ
jgi:hypothetical protein